MHRVLIIGVLVFSIIGAHGQSAKPAEQVPVSQVASPQAIQVIVDRVEHDLTRAARAMPAAKYGFTPTSLNIPGANYTGVRTFAEEVKHVAWSNYATAAGVAGAEPTADRKTIDGLENKDEIVQALADSFNAVHKAMATITPANQNQAAEDVGVGGKQTKESLAAWVAVHGYDHYGQMVGYLRINGIVP